MYFFLEKGKQVLDMRGDLVLTHNPALVVGRIKSAAPRAVRNARYIEDVRGLTFWGKLRASRAALRFIWTRKSEALDYGEH